MNMSCMAWVLFEGHSAGGGEEQWLASYIMIFSLLWALGIDTVYYNLNIYIIYIHH